MDDALGLMQVPHFQANLWIQTLSELRQGVKLKKTDYTKTPIEFELTPYEILMDDIRSRRYKLNKVMVDGEIPHRIKKDAHDIILEFIRSRPPLKPVSPSEKFELDSLPSFARVLFIHWRLLRWFLGIPAKTSALPNICDPSRTAYAGDSLQGPQRISPEDPRTSTGSQTHSK